jgi:hypothetical protein
MTLPEHAGLLVLAGCLVLAIALVVAGCIRVAREGGVLKQRLVAYADLPLKDDVRLANRRIELAEHRIATLPAMLARAERANAEIGTAGYRIRTMAGTVVKAVRSYFR